MVRVIVLFITCFVMDNLLVSFLPIQPMFGSYSAIPNVFLMCLCFFTFYDRGNKALVFAIIFGILYDICYADLFGIYTCLFQIITFLLQRFVSNSMPVNILSMLALFSIVIVIEEWAVYFLVNTMMVTNVSGYAFVKLILFPTLLFNSLVVLVLYPILKSQFGRYQKQLEHM